MVKLLLCFVFCGLLLNACEGVDRNKPECPLRPLVNETKIIEQEHLKAIEDSLLFNTKFLNMLGVELSNNLQFSDKDVTKIVTELKQNSQDVEIHNQLINAICSKYYYAMESQSFFSSKKSKNAAKKDFEEASNQYVAFLFALLQKQNNTNFLLSPNNNTSTTVINNSTVTVSTVNNTSITIVNEWNGNKPNPKKETTNTPTTTTETK